MTTWPGTSIPKSTRNAYPPAGRNPPTLGGRGNTSFAAETEAVSGESKRRINEHLARAEAIGDDLERVTGTSLDKGVELDALKAMPDRERKPIEDALVALEIIGNLCEDLAET